MSHSLLSKTVVTFSTGREGFPTLVSPNSHGMEYGEQLNTLRRFEPSIKPFQRHLSRTGGHLWSPLAWKNKKVRENLFLERAARSDFGSSKP